MGLGEGFVGLVGLLGLPGPVLAVLLAASTQHFMVEVGHCTFSSTS